VSIVAPKTLNVLTTTLTLLSAVSKEPIKDWTPWNNSIMGLSENLTPWVNNLKTSLNIPVSLAHSEKLLTPSAILSINLVKAPPSLPSPIVKNNSSKALPSLFCAPSKLSVITVACLCAIPLTSKASVNFATSDLFCITAKAASAFCLPNFSASGAISVNPSLARLSKAVFKPTTLGLNLSEPDSNLISMFLSFVPLCSTVLPTTSTDAAAWATLSPDFSAIPPNLANSSANCGINTEPSTDAAAKTSTTLDAPPAALPNWFKAKVTAWAASGTAIPAASLSNIDASVTSIKASAFLSNSGLLEPTTVKAWATSTALLVVSLPILRAASDSLSNSLPDWPVIALNSLIDFSNCLLTSKPSWNTW